MTDTNQLPPLPTLQPGDSHAESLIESAIQGHASIREAMRWLVRQLMPMQALAQVQATQAEVTDEQILSLDCVSIDSNEHGTSFWVDRSTVIKFARAILAMRPAAVPMTDEALWTAVIEHLGPETLSGGRMSILDAFHLGITVAEAHHGITTQAKKETP